MILTIFYMVATGFQSWRLRSMYQKISRILDGKKDSVVFFKSSNDVNAGSITSDLCSNQYNSTIIDCFWSNDYSRGISVTPLQKLHLAPFITFPDSTSKIPFNFTSTNDLVIVNEDAIYTLIETDLFPSNDQAGLQIESYGELLAWKIDTRLAILLKTDTQRFSQLILSTFMQNEFVMNDSLPLTRIQTVSVDGIPQDYDQIVNHSRKDLLQRQHSKMTPDQWDKHVEGIKNLGVLANQATEFEYKKNLTEGKTGIVQPDLISSKNIEESLLKVVTSPDTPKKKLLSLEKMDDKLMNMKSELKKHQIQIPETVVSTSTFPKSPDRRVDINAALGQSGAKNVDIKSPMKIIDNKSTTPAKDVAMFPTGSPAKVSNEPVMINKPKVVKMEPKISPANEPVVNEVNPVISNIVDPSSNVVNVENLKTQIPSLVAEPNVIMPNKQEQTPIKDSTSQFIEQEKQKSIAKFPEVLAIEKPKLTPAPIPSITSVLETSKTTKSTQSLRRKKQRILSAKPPNILVYSDSVVTRDNVIRTLGSILEKNMHTIYPLTNQQTRSKIWLENATLLIVCGAVSDSDISSTFLDFFFKGGKMLCLCSDLLHNVLPTYHTAEVREHELVQFSYGKWKNIKMMHHIFCYQPSPVRKHFSCDSDDPPTTVVKTDNTRFELPSSVELKDQYGISHNIRVQTLGFEETWKTPSLLLVYTDGGGKIVFSQVHLEVDPSLYENDETKYQILKKNDGLRLEILTDVLSSHLGIVVSQQKNDKLQQFTNGFFLGRHELKNELLDLLKPLMESENLLKFEKLSVKFCGKNVKAPMPEAHNFPILIHSCPDDFSTVDYFDTLNTDKVGRLLVYSQLLTSSMAMLKNVKYVHGFAVIPRQQTDGSGRSNNMWLSPSGCLMFSLQLHVPLQSALGERVSLIQHLVATAVVTSILKQSGYQNLDIKLKWPNDIYANGDVKIGGLVVTSMIDADMAVCNVGLGLNLSNSNPTTCVNDLITAYNMKYSTKLPFLTFEKTLAIIFNEIEELLNKIQNNNGLEYLYQEYYKHWLHSGTTVTVRSPSGAEKTALITGIDDYGFLKIQVDGSKQTESVQPDGNSFDMLRGLINPK
ncbi:unnamed protein product [Diamesa serratosioi]